MDFYTDNIKRATGLNYSAPLSEIPTSIQLYHYSPALGPFFFEWEKAYGCYQETFLCVQVSCCGFFHRDSPVE